MKNKYHDQIGNTHLKVCKKSAQALLDLPNIS